MTIDTAQFAAITGRLAELEARVEEIGDDLAFQAAELLRQDARVRSMFDALAAVYGYARLPVPAAIRRPRHLSAVQPGDGGAA